MAFKIGNVEIGGDRTVIIAEAGVNHIGRMDYAEELVKTAARAGADIVKWQTYKADKLTTRRAPRFWNWSGERVKGGSQHDSYSILDNFNRPEYEKLRDLCYKYDVEFLSTPFDENSVDMLVELGMKGFKIASGDITNVPLIRYIARKGLPILLSTGASSVDEIRHAVKTIESEGNTQICVMHCTLSYPTDPEDANLAALRDLEVHFPNYPLGLSDHTLGPRIASGSVLLGAKAIEKHYTFDKTLPDSADHWLSLDEPELAQLVSDVRLFEKAYGSGEKVVLESEKLARANARRSLVTARTIEKGEEFTPENLRPKRPGHGISPIFYDQLLGARASKDLQEDAPLQAEDVNGTPSEALKDQIG